MIGSRPLEHAEHAAWEDLYRACPSALAEQLGLAVDRIDGALYLQARAVPATQFNRLCDLDTAAPGATIAAACARFRAAGIAQAWLQPVPGANLAAMTAALDGAGLRPQPRRWAKFWRPPAPAPSPRTAFEIVAPDRARAGAFADTVLAGFGMPSPLKPWLEALPGRPGWQCFLAMAHEGPAAAAAMRIEGPVAWLGIGATRLDYRRKGAQSALLAARIAMGLAAGATGFTTETGVPLPGEPGPSFANIQRAGFVIAYERPNWALPAM